jgi:hypothetical protein
MSKEKTATMKVMKNEDLNKSVSELSKEERTQLVADINAEIERRNSEINNKLYIVEGGAEAGERFLKFISEEAQWKFTEAFGIVEVCKEIQEAIQSAKGGKELFLKVLPLEAIWFFINKVEGVGLEKAKYYQQYLLKPMGEALSRVKADRDAINDLMMKAGSLEAGADFEKDYSLQSETENAN